MLKIFEKSLWNKELWSWYLYNFAAAFIFINITLYFSQWAVIDKNVPDIVFSVPLILATVILLFASTYIGDLGDRKGSHFKIFIATIILTAVSVGGMFLTGRYLFGVYSVVFALLFFFLYQAFYQISIVPYYSFIKYISKSEDYGKVSGLLGTFAELGNISGILVSLPIIWGKLTFFGTDKLSPLVPGILLFVLFAIPIYFALRNKRFVNAHKSSKNFILSSFWKNLKESRKKNGVFPFLIAFYFFSDAILTLTLYSSILIQRVFNASENFTAAIFLIVLVGFACGAIIAGLLNRPQNQKNVLFVFLLITSLGILLTAWTYSLLWVRIFSLLLVLVLGQLMQHLGAI